MSYYETIAEVLLACRPVLKTVTPRKDLAALEAVWKGTLEQVVKAEDRAEPVFDKMRVNTALWEKEWWNGDVLSELLRWEARLERQRQRCADLQWTVWVRDNAVTEDEAVWAYLLDLRNILLDKRLQEPHHLDLDAIEETMASLDAGSDPAGLELPVVEVVEEDWGSSDGVLEWKPLSQFTSTDLNSIAEWYEGQVGYLFADEGEYEDR